MSVSEVTPDREVRSIVGTIGLLGRQPVRAGVVLALALGAWLFLAWIVVDMRHPFAALAMPSTSAWSAGNLLAVGAMWAVMMAAMMLPSALPMILTFAEVSRARGEQGRSFGFVAAYLVAWAGFSAAAAGLQWGLQRAGWVDPMLVSRSAPLTAVLLLVAGLYQFSPLKRVCLSRCRTPLGFLLGEWRPGVPGAFRMGLRHGWLCMGCCWALMALLFIGGVMNLAWIAALSMAVAIEKLAPRGERLAQALGVALLMIGLYRLLVAVS